MIKIIIFDYDGVIVDSFEKVHEVYQIICEKLGKKCPKDLEDFRKIYGLTSREAVKNLEFSEDEIKKSDVIYKEEILKKDPAIFKGIKETIKKLSEKYRLVLISSSPKIEVFEKLDKYSLTEYFEHIFASESGTPTRKVDSIKKTFEIFGIKPKESIMIGDRVIDYLEARSVGIPSKNIIIVDYGWGYDPASLPNYKKDFPVEKPEDILKTISSLEKE